MSHSERATNEAAEDEDGAGVARIDESPSALLKYSLRQAELPDEVTEPFKHYYRRWGHFESRRIRHWYDFQLEDITTLVQSIKAPQVLDAGCGTGTESLWFALNGASVTGIDIDDAFLALADARRKELENTIGRALDCRFSRTPILKMSGRFDLIWLENAFHHMEPRDRVVQKLADLLVPGGHLVFCETNAWNPLLQWQFYQLRGTQTITHYEGEMWGNERILTPGSLTRQLRNVGLRPLRTRYFRNFPASAKFESLLQFERLLAGLPFNRLAAPIFTHYGLIAQKPR